MKVVDPQNPNRTLFDGDEESARDFVEQHAPRTHSVDGVASPLLTLEGGEYFDGTDWVKPSASKKESAK